MFLKNLLKKSIEIATPKKSQEKSSKQSSKNIQKTKKSLTQLNGKSIQLQQNSYEKWIIDNSCKKVIKTLMCWQHFERPETTSTSNKIFRPTSKIFFDSKGQLISKCIFGVLNFLQKTNKNKSHSSKIEFIRSFFGENVDLKKSFRFCLTFISSACTARGQRAKNKNKT